MADFPPDVDVCGALQEHVSRFFEGCQIDVLGPPPGPIAEQNPHFRVLRVGSDQPGDTRVYVTIGGWAATEHTNQGLEFILATPFETDRAVELLAMNVYYHRGGRLGLGDTVPIGEPWLPGSLCDHYLISLPYPYGPELQNCHVGDRHIDFLWLLPITKAERDFKAEHGLEALEQRFEDDDLDYWDPHRSSVI